MNVVLLIVYGCVVDHANKLKFNCMVGPTRNQERGNTRGIKIKSGEKKEGLWLWCRLSMIIKHGWGKKGEVVRDKLSFSYLTGYFGGVSDMYHGRGDLQAWEVLAPHELLKVLLIVFLLAAKIRQGTDRAQITTCKQCWFTMQLPHPVCTILRIMTPIPVSAVFKCEYLCMCMSAFVKCRSLPWE